MILIKFCLIVSCDCCYCCLLQISPKPVCKVTHPALGSARHPVLSQLLDLLRNIPLNIYNIYHPKWPHQALPRPLLLRVSRRSTPSGKSQPPRTSRWSARTTRRFRFILLSCHKHQVIFCRSCLITAR